MTRAPDIRYAKTVDGVHIAYQVVGDGPIDLVVTLGWTTNIEALWQQPALARWLEALSSFTRLILFDKRGMGLSDRVTDERMLSIETRMDDTRTVMDAAGSERAVIFGISEGGPLSVLFVASHPDRALGLILFGTAARYAWAPDYPWGKRDDELEASLADTEQRWGTREFAVEQVRLWGAPSHADDDALIDWLASYMRGAASPGGAVALDRVNHELDVRSALSAVHVPTLIVARAGDRDFLVDEVRVMAAGIRGARLVELPGDEHFFWLGDGAAILREIEGFVASIRHEEAELDRILATVLVTDIVASTERAAAIGDRAWTELLGRHQAMVRGLLARYRGREVDTAGDGFLATFDGPIRAIRAGLAIAETSSELGLDVRVGCHTGEVELVGSNVRGIAVHIAARVCAAASDDEMLVSSTVRDLVAGSGVTFQDRGEQELKGVPEPMRLFAAIAPAADSAGSGGVRLARRRSIRLPAGRTRNRPVDPGGQPAASGPNARSLARVAPDARNWPADRGGPAKRAGSSHHMQDPSAPATRRTVCASPCKGSTHRVLPRHVTCQPVQRGFDSLRDMQRPCGDVAGPRGGAAWRRPRDRPRDGAACRSRGNGPRMTSGVWAAINP